MKGAQLGMSTTALVRAMWMLTTFRHHGHPDDAHRPRRGQVHPGPASTRSSVAPSTCSTASSTSTRSCRSSSWSHPGQLEGRRQRGQAVEVPRSTIYFSGASTEKDAVSMDADLLVHDEEDLSDPQIIDQFEHRLDASRFGWKVHLSTPRLPGAGIDAVFQTTDKRRWLVRCPGAPPSSRWRSRVGPGRMPTSSPTRPTGPRRLAALGARWATGTVLLPPLRPQPDTRGPRRRTLGPRGADAGASAWLRHQPARGALVGRRQDPPLVQEASLALGLLEPHDGHPLGRGHDAYHRGRHPVTL